MADRSFVEILALLSEHDQLNDLTGTAIDDDFIDLLCIRLSELPIPPVHPDEVRRAWTRQRVR